MSPAKYTNIKTQAQLEHYIGRQYPELRQGLGQAVVRTVFMAIRQSLEKQLVDGAKTAVFDVPGFGSLHAQLATSGWMIVKDGESETVKRPVKLGFKSSTKFRQHLAKMSNQDHVEAPSVDAVRCPVCRNPMKLCKCAKMAPLDWSQGQCPVCTRPRTMCNCRPLKNSNS